MIFLGVLFCNSFGPEAKAAAEKSKGVRFEGDRKQQEGAAGVEEEGDYSYSLDAREALADQVGSQTLEEVREALAVVEKAKQEQMKKKKALIAEARGPISEKEATLVKNILLDLSKCIDDDTDLGVEFKLTIPKETFIDMVVKKVGPPVNRKAAELVYNRIIAESGELESEVLKLVLETCRALAVGGAVEKLSP